MGIKLDQNWIDDDDDDQCIIVNGCSSRGLGKISILGCTYLCIQIMHKSLTYFLFI